MLCKIYLIDLYVDCYEKEDYKVMIDECKRVNKQIEENKLKTRYMFAFISLVIGFYSAYDLLPPNDFISFIGFIFMGLVASIGMLMLFSFIFRF